MNDSRHKYLPFFILFFIVLISRLPFLWAGYGVEEDSWGIALAAFRTKLSGVYEPSRFPGHPVQELIYSILWGTGPALFNGLCALFSAIATVYFAKILQHLSFKYFFWAALSFAFVPIVYISSTYTIDFIWSEAFVLMSLFYLLKNKFVLAGIFIGLAVGCRITCGVMLLPFLIIIWQQGELKQNVVALFKITASMLVIAVITFFPIILQFGSSFFMYYDQFPYPPLTKLFYKMVLGVWGFVGVVSLFVAFFAAIINKQRQSRGSLFASPLDKKIIYASFLIIALYSVSYFRLPQKAGYMLPIVPFVILLFGYYLNAKNFKLLCYAFIVSSFVCSINLTDKFRGATHSKMAVTFTVSGQELFFDLFSGPIFSDYSKRLQKIKYTNEVMDKVKEQLSPIVIISGWWYNEIMVTSIGLEINKSVVFEPYINDEKMQEYISKGYQLVYLPEQNIYNDQMYKMEATNNLAKPF